MIFLVADSSALILLAKCTLLEIICNLFSVCVTETVVSESASEEFVNKYPDAALIADLISKESIVVKTPKKSGVNLSISLDPGEKEALQLAMTIQGSLFASDDGKAIKAARFCKIPFIITPRLVTELYRLRKISFEKARGAIEKLGVIGRYSPEIIANATLRLMEYDYGKTDNDKNS